MNITQIIGWAGSIVLALGYLPQTIKTIRTRSTDDIALGSFVMMAAGAMLFMIQGILMHNWSLAAANFLTFSMSTIIFVIKMINDYGRNIRNDRH